MTRSIRRALTVAALAIGLAAAANSSQAAGQTDDLTFAATLSPANEMQTIAEVARAPAERVHWRSSTTPERLNERH